MNELTNNDAGRDEVAGTDVKAAYEKLIRRSYGISKISNAKNLQTLRNDARSLQSDLNAQVAELEASVESVEDPLDRLAQLEAIEMVKGQVVKLDSVLDSVGNRVTELLSA